MSGGRYPEQLLGYEKDDNNRSLWLWDDLPEMEMEVGYKVSRLLHYEKSAFQEISVAQTRAFGKMLVLDGVPQITEKDGFIYNEMITHIPLLTHPGARKIAMIGGGTCGPAKEACRYAAVEQIDVIEIDPRVTAVCELYLGAESATADLRVRLFHEDGAKWLKKTELKQQYDVLLIDRSDPYGPSAALYTNSFYNSVYESLSAKGVAAFQSGSPFFDAKGLAATVAALKKRFPFVCVYITAIPSFPGGIWSFTVASKSADPKQADLSNMPQPLRYLNAETFHAAFQLPHYMKNFLE